jgi:hypothetical protein
MRQPWPDAGVATDDAVHRREHAAADDRAIHERHAHRIVALADFDAVEIVRNQRTGNAEVFLVAEQVIGILDAKRQADQGRDRRQGDVALLPVQAQAEHLLAVDDAFLDDAGRLRRRGVGSGFGTVRPKHGISSPLARRGR